MRSLCAMAMMARLAIDVDANKIRASWMRADEEARAQQTSRRRRRSSRIAVVVSAACELAARLLAPAPERVRCMLTELIGDSGVVRAQASVCAAHDRVCRARSADDGEQRQFADQAHS